VISRRELPTVTLGISMNAGQKYLGTLAIERKWMQSEVVTLATMLATCSRCGNAPRQHRLWVECAPGQPRFYVGVKAYRRNGDSQ
jgi:ribosomal protein L32